MLKGLLWIYLEVKIKGDRCHVTITVKGLELGLWCLTLLSTIFQLQMYIVAVSFIYGRNLSTRKKLLIHSQVTDKPSHIKLITQVVVSQTTI